MQATLRRPQLPAAARTVVKPVPEARWATLRALGAAALTLLGVHRH